MPVDLPPLVISYDMGGSVVARMDEIRRLAAERRQVVIDGPCASACTLYVMLPKAQVCGTRRAAFGFHSASFMIAGRMVASAAITQALHRYYSPAMRRWIARQGPLTYEKVVWMRTPELHRHLTRCPVTASLGNRVAALDTAAAPPVR